MQPSKLNLDLLASLLKDNKNAIKQALELFVETTNEDMEILRGRIEDGKFHEASRLAHSLKSRFVYLGNDDACQKVKSLESLLKEERENSYNEVKDQFDNLNYLINFCINQVNEEIKTLEN